jgi:hypothetical protein
LTEYFKDAIVGLLISVIREVELFSRRLRFVALEVIPRSGRAEGTLGEILVPRLVREKVLKFESSAKTLT